MNQSKSLTQKQIQFLLLIFVFDKAFLRLLFDIPPLFIFNYGLFLYIKIETS